MKKILFVVLFAFLLFTSFGCKKETVKPAYISAENIFEIESDKYLVYFEKETCSQCAQALPHVIDYLTETSGKKGAIIIYRVSLEYTDEEGNIQSIPISRSFTEANTGQGPDGNFYVNGVSKWIALYIAAAPSLIEVEKIDGVRQSKLVAVGSSEIERYLNDLRNEK